MAQKIDNIENKSKKLTVYSCKYVKIIRYKLFKTLINKNSHNKIVYIIPKKTKIFNLYFNYYIRDI